MKPTKIAFTKKYFPEQYHGEDYFIEYILEEGESILDAFKKAKEETLQCFKNNNPQIQWHDEVIQVDNSKKYYPNTTFRVPPEPLNMSNKELANLPEYCQKASEEKTKTGTIEEQIQACTEISYDVNKGILSFEIMAKMNPKLKEIYDKKLSELQPPSPVKNSKLQTNFKS